MILFILASAMLYGPYGWCLLRHESYDKYNLLWRLDRKSLKETALAVVFTLAPLTLISMNWPGHGLPRSVTFREFLALASAGGAAAVIEEVFFRGWMQTIAERILGPTAAIFAVSVLFSLSHLFLKVHWLRLATFFPGLVMGFLCQRNKSVAPSALYHLFGNLWAIWFFPPMA